MVIHFICRGNVFRSLIAETYLKSLRLPDVTVISSGTSVDYYGERNLPFFEDTTRLLRAHGLVGFIKPKPEQLTQACIDGGDMTVCFNQRVVDDAKNLPVSLPQNAIVWEIMDIGERPRTEKPVSRGEAAEAIYNEIIAKVDKLVKTLPSLESK